MDPLYDKEFENSERREDEADEVIEDGLSQSNISNIKS